MGKGGACSAFTSIYSRFCAEGPLDCPAGTSVGDVCGGASSSSSSTTVATSSRAAVAPGQTRPASSALVVAVLGALALRARRRGR